MNRIKSVLNSTKNKLSLTQNYFRGKLSSKNRNIFGNKRNLGIQRKVWYSFLIVVFLYGVISNIPSSIQHYKFKKLKYQLKRQDTELTYVEKQIKDMKSDTKSE